MMVKLSRVLETLLFIRKVHTKSGVSTLDSESCTQGVRRA